MSLNIEPTLNQHSVKNLVFDIMFKSMIPTVQTTQKSVSIKYRLRPQIYVRFKCDLQLNA